MCFVNGIPIVVAEFKSPGIESPLSAAINQLLRYSNQRREIWPTLYHENEGVERLFHTNLLPIARLGRRRTASVFLIVFFALLLTLPVLAAAAGDGTARLIDGFYRAGSLVFGGGHVVLPLLQAEVVDTGLVGRDVFLAGYGAAQAVPGPLFTFAAYLGAVMQTPPTGLLGATIALIAIFVPSALLIIGGLPFWDRLRSAPLAQRALAGVNAAVVGLLAAALYDPVFTEGVVSPLTMAIAAAAFVALAGWRTPAWAAVIGAGVVGFIIL